MIYDRVSPITIALLALLVLGAIYFYGVSSSSTCMSIGTCKACYNDFYKPVDYSLCVKNATASNATSGYVCVLDKNVEKHNAMVDLLMCACKTYPKRFTVEKEKLHRLLVYSSSRSEGNFSACNFNEFPVVRWNQSYILVPKELLNRPVK